MTTANTTAAKPANTSAAFAPIHGDLLDDLSRQADLVAIRNLRRDPLDAAAPVVKAGSGRVLRFIISELSGRWAVAH